MNENEKKCLAFLANHYHSDTPCFHFQYIANETNLTRKQVRRACRSLARKGSAKYERGLFTEDGAVAGSGYRCTAAGAAEQPPVDA